MKTIVLYGASDDLVELEIDGGTREELSEPSAFVFTAGGKSLHAELAHDGKFGWRITVAIDDDKESGSLPFTVRIEQEAYSPKLVVEVTTVPVTLIWWQDKRPHTETVYP